MCNPSVEHVPGRNTLVVCADCKKSIRSLTIPNDFIVLCFECWDERNRVVN